MSVSPCSNQSSTRWAKSNEPLLHLKTSFRSWTTGHNCRVLKGTRWSVWYKCVATYSGRLAMARSFIRQQQQQYSSAKLLSWCIVYFGYSVPLPWCTKVAYGVRYAVSVLVTMHHNIHKYNSSQNAQEKENGLSNLTDTCFLRPVNTQGYVVKINSTNTSAKSSTTGQRNVTSVNSHKWQNCHFYTQTDALFIILLYICIFWNSQWLKVQSQVYNTAWCNGYDRVLQSNSCSIFCWGWVSHLGSWSYYFPGQQTF